MKRYKTFGETGLQTPAPEPTILYQPMDSFYSDSHPAVMGSGLSHAIHQSGNMHGMAASPIESSPRKMHTQLLDPIEVSPPPYHDHGTVTVAPEQTSQWNCFDVMQHIESCPVCSRIYKREDSTYILIIIGLVMILLFLLTRLLR